MSVHVTSWVFRHSEAKLGERLVLLVLAGHAKDDGTSAWPSVETIARQCRLSDRQVQRCLRGLEESGEITRTGRSKRGTSVYEVTGYIRHELARGGGDILSPHQVAVGVTSATAGGDISDTGGDVDVTRSVLELSVEPSGPSVPRAREVERIGARALTGEKAWKVDRRPVTFDEDQAARAILAEWNAVTGQRLESRDWLAKIVMRVRERPELSIVDHGRLIRATLEAPWWKGSASPSVVYGNGAVFERALTVADETPGRRAVNGRAPKRYGRGMTTREILERTGSS